jgi:hypothetical protein
LDTKLNNATRPSSKEKRNTFDTIGQVELVEPVVLDYSQTAHNGSKWILNFKVLDVKLKNLRVHSVEQGDDEEDCMPYTTTSTF